MQTGEILMLEDVGVEGAQEATHLQRKEHSEQNGSNGSEKYVSMCFLATFSHSIPLRVRSDSDLLWTAVLRINVKFLVEHFT
jgi:hypothetical protein